MTSMYWAGKFEQNYIVVNDEYGRRDTQESYRGWKVGRLSSAWNWAEDSWLVSAASAKRVAGAPGALFTKFFTNWFTNLFSNLCTNLFSNLFTNLLNK